MNDALQKEENSRLSRLHGLGLLSHQPVAGLDKLVGLAAKLCRVPVSVVAIIGARSEHVLASHGLLAAGLCPRELSLSSKVLTSEQGVLIVDAQQGETWPSDPWVSELGMRAYAGVPLVLEDGIRLGAIAVMSPIVNTFNAETLATLAALADEAVELVNAHREQHLIAPEAEHAPKAKREEQASKIIGSARTILVEQGGARFSMRKVAESAGLTLGHLQHYFRKRADLLEATAEAIANELLEMCHSRCVAFPNPADRLITTTDRVLQSDVAARTASELLELSMLAPREPAVSQQMTKLMEGVLGTLERTLLEMSPTAAPSIIQERSIEILTLLSGVHLVGRLTRTLTDQQRTEIPLRQLEQRVFDLGQIDVVGNDVLDGTALDFATLTATRTENQEPILGMQRGSLHSKNLVGRVELTDVCDQVRATFGCDRSSVFLRHRNHVRGAFNSGNPPEQVATFGQLPIDLNTPGLKQVADNGTFALSNNPLGDGFIDKKIALASGIQALIVAPFYDSGNVLIGVLTAEYCEREGRFSESDGEKLMVFAKRCSERYAESLLA